MTFTARHGVLRVGAAKPASLVELEARMVAAGRDDLAGDREHLRVDQHSAGMAVIARRSLENVGAERWIVDGPALRSRGPSGYATSRGTVTTAATIASRTATPSTRATDPAKGSASGPGASRRKPSALPSGLPARVVAASYGR